MKQLIGCALLTPPEHGRLLSQLIQQLRWVAPDSRALNQAYLLLPREVQDSDCLESRVGDKVVVADDIRYWAFITVIKENLLLARVEIEKLSEAVPKEELQIVRGEH